MVCKGGCGLSRLAGLFIAATVLVAGCGEAEQSNLSPSGLDHPEKVAKAIAEREAREKAAKEAERRMFRGKTVDSGEPEEQTQ